ENFAKVYELVKALSDVGAKYGKSPSQVALNWLLMASDKVIVIPGAKNPSQVEENAGASGWRMSLDDWMMLEEESGRIRITRVTW
ncbi:MAG: aldo/keto reductase, partial [Candidatus Korarchaeum sp.]|nr:aldo/keto reductase [Candidatus Korarchaeum sp.]MDW8035360.1 aldo/keto reductase [Candidatus Korarchaeum sp.]